MSPRPSVPRPAAAQEAGELGAIAEMVPAGYVFSSVGRPRKLGPVPVYEYRCRSCGSDFELRRPMAESNAPAPCPEGDGDGLRRMSVVSTIGSAGPTMSAAPAPAMGCGGGCVCH